jgi:hypothetical protein
MIGFDKIYDRKPQYIGECNDESYIFLQMPCMVPSDQIVRRKICGLGIACFGVFLYLFVFISIEYIKAI